ncbi:phosphatidylglycerophosphatase A [Solidesulfovibrio fructosivorans JJ]]|uniref:Phosphatidylglycerophosphatase A n=1 Tax=Solidesulfovibrio fructosivorans JJ] TaxID=596151 RepID=E1K0I3_SOLFR|nr:phosphatidylglycerophosphatase A [Solidesulfovibrio fructosivorans]EFL49835.1 phosphatidylglycerophosphatase A [Solidesulfovibrio fructosivorans JJ]]
MTTGDRLSLLVSGLGPIGKIPYASGTWGSAAATIAAPALFLPLPGFWRVLILIALFFIGSFTATRTETLLQKKDPSHVVIDELIGQWVTFLPFASLPTLELAAGFLLFRAFDILKPPPVRASENWLPAGYGVMIDDVLAGIYACICLAIFHWLRS